MSRSFRHHLFTKYYDSPHTSWKWFKTYVHRKNRCRCRQSIRNGREPVPDIPYNRFDYDNIKIYQGRYPNGHRFHNKHKFTHCFLNILKRK